MFFRWVGDGYSIYALATVAIFYKILLKLRQRDSRIDTKFSTIFYHKRYV